MTILKTLPKRIPTNEEGIFYKSIINENNKEIDKICLIRYKENDNDKLKWNDSKLVDTFLGVIPFI